MFITLKQCQRWNCFLRGFWDETNDQRRNPSISKRIACLWNREVLRRGKAYIKDVNDYFMYICSDGMFVQRVRFMGHTRWILQVILTNKRNVVKPSFWSHWSAVIIPMSPILMSPWPLFTFVNYSVTSKQKSQRLLAQLFGDSGSRIPQARGRHPPSLENENLLFSKIFAKTAWKWKKLDGGSIGARDERIRQCLLTCHKRTLPCLWSLWYISWLLFC